MRLHLDESRCNNCLECLKACPAGLKKTSSISCVHCKPDEAPCKEACPKKAIYEIAEGILSIDKEKCNGCGKCAKACPVSAIEIAEGKASKCNLCAENSFFTACISRCPFSAISKTRDENEQSSVERLLGWGCLKAKGKRICSSTHGSIVKGNEGIIYSLDLPLLSRQEASLVKSIRDELIECEEKKSAADFLKQYCRNNLIELDEEQEKYLSGILDMLAVGFGPISKVAKDDSIEEIALVGIGKENPVYVYKREVGWLKTNFYYADEESAIKAINAMARGIGRRITLQKPKLNAVLEDGSRLSAAISPVATNGATFTIRKFRQKPFTPAELINNKTISAEACAFLWLALEAEASVMIAGNTGSGKTTTLNSLFFFISEDERIIIVEETPEISIAQKHKVKVIANEELSIGLEELINETLRMRPDRIVVGEIRSKEEIRAFIDTLLAGQGRGSFATFHAQSADEAITRLKSKGIDEVDIASLDLIIVQRRWVCKKKGNKEIRRVSEIAEVRENDGKARAEIIYSYDYGKDCLVRQGGSTKVAEKIMRCFGMNDEEMEKELEKRKIFLQRAACSKQSIDAFRNEISAYEWPK